MGKKLIIKGADFFVNGIQPDNIVYLTQNMLMSGYPYYIANGKASDNSSSYKGGFIDISSYEGYTTLMVKKEPSKGMARFTFVTQLPTAAGQTISFATGYSDNVTITDDNIHEYSIPSNASYLYVMYYHTSQGNNIFPNRLALK